MSQRPVHRATVCLLRSCALALLCAALAGAAQPDDGDDAAHAHEHDHDRHEETEEIIVTSTPLEHAQDELAVPVDRLDRAELLEKLGTTLGETLADEPGIATTSFAPGASRPVIRGQNAFRTEVLEGGLSTQDVSRLSPDHGVPVNPLTAQRIEVVRGPATLRYGGGASAGVVNAITGRVPDRALDEPFRGEVFGAFGENANEREVALLLEGQGGPLGFHFDGLVRDRDDYEIPGDGTATQDGTDVAARAVSGGASWFPKWGRLGFAYARFDNDYGIPEEGEDVSIDMRTNRYRLEGDLDAPFAGADSLRLRAVYSDYQHDEIAEGVISQTFDNDEFDGRLELLHEPVLGFVGAVGLHGRYQDFEGGGEAEEFLAPTDTTSVAGYLFEERRLAERLSLEAGLRVEGTRVHGTDVSDRDRTRSFVPVSGALGLVVDLDDAWSVGLTSAVSQRAPSQVELFARGPHEATGTFEIGEPGLNPETSYTTELRVDGVLGPVVLSGAAFVTWYEDYIDAFLAGDTVDEDGNPVAATEDDALDLLLYRSRDARFWGGELSAEIQLVELCGGALVSDWSFDWVRARFTEGGGDRDLPRITPIRWGGGLAFRSELLRARLGFRRTESQRQAAAGETRTGGFTLLDFGVTLSLGAIDERIPVALSVTGRNLTNEEARNHLSFNKDEVLLPGRSIRVGLHARF
jgi:iron complex outermembrane receptor protein